MATQNFAIPSDNDQYLLGVIFDDADGDQSYDAGEGLDDVLVTATSQTTGAEWVTQSLSQGGYQLPLEADTYTLEFSWQEQNHTEEVELTGINTKLDWIVA